VQLASASNHYYSAAIRHFADRQTWEQSIEDIQTVPGRGIEARFKSEAAMNDCSARVLLGSLAWLSDEGLQLSTKLRRTVEEAGGNDLALTCIGWDGRIRGAFLFREEHRSEARAVLDQCRRLGLEVMVVTGDRRPHAGRLGEILNVPVLAEQLPETKVAAVLETRREFGPVAMVGDGINDAPALAASDVGVALSCGADLSRDSAAVCLLSDDLGRLPWTLQLSRQTIRVIRQNLGWAFSYNLVGIGLAASGRLSPVFAALAMVASSAFVVSNSLRLGRFPKSANDQLPAANTESRNDIASQALDLPRGALENKPGGELQLAP
jgi:cation transport ATPase